MKPRFVFAFLAVVLLTTYAAAQNTDLQAVRNSPSGKVQVAPPVQVAPSAKEEVIQGPQWVTLAPIPIANGLSQTTIVAASNGLIYSIGGGLGAGPDVTINQVWAYNPEDDTWTQKANIPTTIRAFDSAAFLNGSIYVFGGFDGVALLNTLWVYNVEKDTWSRGRNLPFPQVGSAVDVLGNTILIAGSGQTLQYDPETDTYTQLFPMPVSLLRIHGTTLADKGQFETFAGGFDGTASLVYSSDTDTWCGGRTMPFGVTDPGVENLDGLIYVLGGIDPPGGRTQIYNPADRTWSQGPRMPGLTNNTGSALLNGTIYVIGGFNGVTSVPTNFALTVGGMMSRNTARPKTFFAAGKFLGKLCSATD